MTTTFQQDFKKAGIKAQVNESLNQYIDIFIVDGIENKIVKEYCHPNTGIYAVEIEDAQNRRAIISPDDIKFP